ncbi:unnamed protein product [Rotaria sordida]|nr:unnamed protein product [Rotaria sordida]CAF1597597.1 unnamed protein product [Rotaria sordida]
MINIIQLMFVNLPIAIDGMSKKQFSTAVEMGQQVSLSNLKVIDLLATNNQHSVKALSDGRIEDVYLFLPLDVMNSISKNSILCYNQKNSIELPITKKTLTK